MQWTEQISQSENYNCELLYLEQSDANKNVL